MTYHQELEDIVEDQLSLASIHYLRSHYQEAIDIYKRILLDNREYLALNVYVALCYYKLDYYDVSQEVLAVYLQHFPSSVIAINLKACNHFRLYNGKAAEQELKALQQGIWIDRHFFNVVFLLVKDMHSYRFLGHYFFQQYNYRSNEFYNNIRK